MFQAGFADDCMYSTKWVCSVFRTKDAVKLYKAICMNDARHTSNLYAFGFELILEHGLFTVANFFS